MRFSLLFMCYYSTIAVATPISEILEAEASPKYVEARAPKHGSLLPEARIQPPNSGDGQSSRRDELPAPLLGRGPRKLPGTNQDIPGLTPKPPSGFGLTDSDPSNLPSELMNIRSQPAARTSECSGGLPYESCLGGDHGFNTKGVFLPSDGRLLSRHVAQGGIGDCAFGAAVKSMTLTGFQWNLSNNFRRLPKFNTEGWKDSVVLSAKFYREDNAVTHVIIDDGLAKPCSSDYLSFEPVDPDDVLFVPLLEKAFAKLVDAYPDLYRSKGQRKSSTRPETWGINGLTGVSGGKVLRALRGGTAKVALRKNYPTRSAKPGAAQFIDHFKNCVNDRIPCVAGTPSLRVVDEETGATTSMHLDPYPTNRKFLNAKDHAMGGQRASLYGDWTIENVPDVPDRKGLFVRIKNKTLKYDFTLVEYHAYALSPSTKSGYIVISNPWNCNPNPADGSCDGNGEHTIPIKLAAAVFNQIEWVE